MSESTRSILAEDGSLVGTPPSIPDADLVKMFRHMLGMRVLDQRMLSLQRQGRVGFYGTATGQEAAVTGSAYALRDTDWIFPALREMGVSLWRGTTTKEIVCQLIGNSGDVLMGRQMPCHFSDRRVRSVAWSSVIGTQLAHAMGAAWAAKLQKTDEVMMGYMGDGASSSADFHAAANFAGGEDGWATKGYALRENLLRYLFPVPEDLAPFIDRLDSWLATTELVDSVRRPIIEGRDNAARALRCQKGG